MKQLVVLIGFLFSTFYTFGQSQHLEPFEYSKSEAVNDYYSNVFQLLHKGFSEKPIARYTALPSFTVEYSFSIETLKVKRYIISNTLSQNYWYAKNKKKVVNTSRKVELTNNLYVKIFELFKLLEARTKKPEQEIMGLDGVMYYFATTDKTGQVNVGETWSPDKNSLLDRLVQICDRIYLLSAGENISQTDLSKKIDNLIADFKR